MIYIFTPFFSCLFLCLLAYIRIIVTSAICLFLLCLWLVPTTPTVSAVWGLTGKFNSRPEHSYPVPGTWTQHTGLCGHYILLGLLRTGGRKGRLHNQRHGVAGNDRRSTWEGSIPWRWPLLENDDARPRHVKLEPEGRHVSAFYGFCLLGSMVQDQRIRYKFRVCASSVLTMG